MFVEFDQLSPDSKIWIYQSERKINDKEKDILTERLRKFTENWESHGNPLKGSFKLYYDHFIIIGADESYNTASGCSIDKSVEVIREVEKDLNLKLLERGLVAYKNNEAIDIASFTHIKQLVESGKITTETKVFNNSIGRIKELKQNWEIPAFKSWISKYFNN